jgi:hypothetical protein
MILYHTHAHTQSGCHMYACVPIFWVCFVSTVASLHRSSIIFLSFKMLGSDSREHTLYCYGSYASMYNPMFRAGRRLPSSWTYCDDLMSIGARMLQSKIVFCPKERAHCPQIAKNNIVLPQI